MKFNLKDGIDILSRTPKVLEELLIGLPEEWVHTNEGKDTWDMVMVTVTVMDTGRGIINSFKLYVLSFKFSSNLIHN